MYCYIYIHQTDVENNVLKKIGFDELGSLQNAAMYPFESQKARTIKKILN